MELIEHNTALYYISSTSYLMETPSRPWPPHKVLGVMKSSLTVPLLLLYTVIATSFSMFAWVVGKLFVSF